MRSELVPAVLSEYGTVARARLSEFLPAREPRRWLYDLVADYPRRGGRSFRPSLCIATARAFGCPLDDVLDTAASIELFHNAMLVHDDIEDDSERRRGKPTMHKMYGVPIAVNVGDMLGLLGMRPLFANFKRLGPRVALRILEETERMAAESAEGQAMELGWRHENATDVREADYLEMVLKKTCWLGMIHPVRMGVMVATLDAVDLDRFVRFGFFLGAAFQIQDDLLNLTGDENDYGKELGGDIHEGKRTMMLIRLVEAATPDERARLHAVLALPREQRGLDEVRWIRERMDHYGCIDHARQVAQGLAGAASHEFWQLFGSLPDSRDRRFIEALPRWVIERT
ncbi:polyprenyl synthetase family protein [Nannocystis radixulma]|uniref:Polyprenyl synthetase family protein n=1 Tax=Nannocystis radixulma TaxID=2995305 RepID=A0ABT5B1D0_9BACT|nr:polyprenyl synthetase family protein [Nannocystis radixulma]MDC0667905.1 polyprenyl synthetase family protein [Nannocystis radixulma]